MTPTSNSKRRISGKYVLLFFPVLAVVSFVATHVIVAISTPQGSPTAQMFRTEATLSSLAHAVETYHAAYGAYPPAGDAGLELAVRHLSKTVNYLPGGPPRDSWEHAYYYAPTAAYEVPGSMALKSENGYFSPNSFQLYSAGIDGDPGLEDPRRRVDNITSWEEERPWRAKYRALQQAYFKSHVHAPQ
ncbi:MAG: type II secretion system protein GspG [Candidatus Hydrogenedentales bacterium]